MQEQPQNLVDIDHARKYGFEEDDFTLMAREKGVLLVALGDGAVSTFWFLVSYKEITNYELRGLQRYMCKQAHAD